VSFFYYCYKFEKHSHEYLGFGILNVAFSAKVGNTFRNLCHSLAFFHFVHIMI
jgi:hypothetical protein